MPVDPAVNVLTLQVDSITSQRSVTLAATARELCGALRTNSAAAFYLDGQGGFRESWPLGPLVALNPQPVRFVADHRRADGSAALTELDRLLKQRRALGGSAETGVAVLLAFDFLNPAVRVNPAAQPLCAVLAVDRSVRYFDQGTALLTMRSAGNRSAADRDAALNRYVGLLEGLAWRRERVDQPAAQRPRTSLPREAYLLAAKRVLKDIARGDIYQANLCQRFSISSQSDPYELYCKLSDSSPAPHSAFFEIDNLAVASLSPERFLRQRMPDAIETLPIKGTRPRGADPASDGAAARALLASTKDRAELLMIVDLERNDLGRICRTGTVKVTQLAELHSFANVHHLVARIEGRLRPEIDLPTLLRATFPGGSISGAPKISALKILRELEPVTRGFFTGCLFWFADDGTLDSSILIRSLIMASGEAMIGAGGGIVSDSDPEEEWLESNHKARALTSILGFDPEEAV